jgi:hypothetical protein
VVTYTDNKKLNKPANGEFPDTWDVPVNEDWDIIDKALGGAATFTVAGTDITLTISDAQNQRIVLTGTPGATRNIIIPFRFLSSTTAVGGMWIIDNQTNANQNILTEVSGSNGVTVIAGRRALVYSDGTDVKFADDVRLIGGTGISVSGSTVSLSVPVSVSNGGTGLTTLTSGNVILGNGTSAPTFVAPGAIGNVLTSNGSSWISSAPTGGTGGGITSITFATASGMGLSFTPNTITTSGSTTTLSGTLAVANGGTGAVSLSGLLRGNGTGAVSGNATVNLGTEVTGTLGTSNGGTGTTSVTGSGSVVFSNSPTLSGTTTVSGLTATGTVTINAGTTSASINFNGTSQFINFNSGGFGINSGGPVISGNTGGFIVYGVPFANQTNFSLISDARTKKDIKPYTKSLNDVITLEPITFQFNGQYGTKDDGVTRAGLIAQQVNESNMPEMVGTYVYTDPDTGQKTDLYNLNPSELMFAFINSIKALEARIKALEEQVGP